MSGGEDDLIFRVCLFRVFLAATLKDYGNGLANVGITELLQFRQVVALLDSKQFKSRYCPIYDDS